MKANIEARIYVSPDGISRVTTVTKFFVNDRNFLNGYLIFILS